MTLSPPSTKDAPRKKTRGGAIRLGGVTLGKGPKAAGVIVHGRAQSAARKAANAGADILELRADTFPDASPEAVGTVIKDIKGLGKPVLLTVRSRKEGGASAISDKDRERLYAALVPLVDAVDIELSSGAILENVVKSARGRKKKIIISYHNFKATPGDGKLHDIIDRALKSGADIVKIAAYAKGPEDVRRLASLLACGRNLIVIAMGEHGKASRVFFPMLGSLLTYGSITASTAPGQMSLRELKREFSRYGFGE